jgi:hypothetical protein
MGEVVSETFAAARLREGDGGVIVEEAYRAL